ncbi:hypothetical protein QFZ82_001712 [Streptomyces sp. V4I23]|uniref:hypothetical protein n=1 Tax=Streptomyces sp. V4I23 TaxID=3042282 RepID=UPI00277F59DC|nr:hypothetical protein [Streptomyces sp. V4I23]MDQ1007227.1 hypothetical protein [Streptomyces sp. V4I23]
MRSALTGKAVVLAVLAVLCVQACSSQPKEEKPTPEPSAPYRGNRGYTLPDSPFTREGTVVTASCSMGARYAAVSVQAWDPERWELREERYFPIPTDAAFSNYPGVEAVNSPLVDLCRQTTDNPSPYGVDDLEYMAPRIRALFDLAFTRMAVVLREPGGEATHAGLVENGADQDDFVRLSDATGDDEQNAVMSPDGRSVWFTYTTPAGEHRIGSRAAEGGHRLSDEGPATGHDLPLTVSGKPPHAVQANMVRLAPGGHRLTATAPKVFGNVFGTLHSSGPLTARSARVATLLSGCVGIVGWIGDDRVLCRTSSGSFRTMDARTGRAAGAPIDVVGPRDGTVAEGMLVSADGEKFIVSVHRPNDPYGEPGGSADFRAVPTTAGEEATSISHDFLTTGTVFLDWL